MADNKFEHTYSNIKGVLNSIPENYMLIEQIVDINVQKEFFETINNLHITPEDEIPELINNLNNSCSSEFNNKIILQKLSTFDSVEAYRAIENYCNSAEKEIRDWATLALHHSKLIIQSSLLEEQLVFISTGLGGKNGNFRYNVVFPYLNSNIVLTNLQFKILRKEVEFNVTKYHGEIEECDFTKRFASFIITLPLKAPIPELIKSIIEECNQFGSYLSEDVLITNIKRYSEEDLIDIIEKRKTFEG